MYEITLETDYQAKSQSVLPLYCNLYVGVKLSYGIKETDPKYILSLLVLWLFQLTDRGESFLFGHCIGGSVVLNSGWCQIPELGIPARGRFTPLLCWRFSVRPNRSLDLLTWQWSHARNPWHKPGVRSGMIVWFRDFHPTIVSTPRIWFLLACCSPGRVRLKSLSWTFVRLFC